MLSAIVQQLNPLKTLNLKHFIKMQKKYPVEYPGPHALYINIIYSHRKSRETIPLNSFKILLS